MSANNPLPIANGVLVDGKDKLNNVVDHLNSSAHEEAMLLPKLGQASWTVVPGLNYLRNCTVNN